MKQFAKEVGDPDSFVADMSGEQVSSEVKKFCNDVETTLRAIEEGTPWSNKAELYIGLIKEAVRKAMHESNSLLCIFGLIVLREELGPTTLQPKMPLGSMDPLPTQLQLVMKETSQICVNMHGMNGVTSEIKQQPFPATRKFWAEYLAQPEEQAMKWPNGYSRQMLELYPEDL